MKTASQKNSKASVSLKEMLKGMDAFLPKIVRVQKEHFSDWDTTDSNLCPSKKRAVKNTAAFEL